MVERARVWRAVESVGRGSRHDDVDELKESRQRGGQIVPERRYEAVGHGRCAGGHL
jgi:hypothetical protein